MLVIMLKNNNSFSAPSVIIYSLHTLYNEGKDKELLLRLIKLREIYPNTAEIHNIIGIIAIKKNHDSEAISNFYKAIDLDNNNPDYYSNLGTAFANINAFNQAEQVLTKAIDLDPNNAKTFNNLGNILSKNKRRYKEAIVAYERAIKINLNHYEAYHNLGHIFMKMGEIRNAELAFQKAQKINPHSDEITENLIIFYRTFNKLKKAYSLIKRHINYNPSAKSKFLEIKAELLIGFGNFAEGLLILKRLNKEEPKNFNVIAKILSLSFVDDDSKAIDLFTKYHEIISNNKTQIDPNVKTPIVSLIGFGRSGSLFLHSLLDGHPQISTLPGYFFKGWFNEKTWSILEPDFNNVKWRINLAENICNLFEPQFISRSTKNVIGTPVGETECIGKDKGFTQLGENKDESLDLDINKFKSRFIKKLSKYKTINHKECFKIIHDTFDCCYRKKLDNQLQKIIFYHIHNPEVNEQLNYLCAYPQTKILYLIRDPIKMIESWILDDLIILKKAKNYWELYTSYRNIYDKVCYPFKFLYNGCHTLFQSNSRVIRLEDIKRNPKKTLPKLLKWMGINEDESIYKSEFLNKKYSRPSYSFDKISGFDKSSIDVSKGRFFSSQDIFILETLLWPFLNFYGYTNKKEDQFVKDLDCIENKIFDAFYFEESIFKYLNNKSTKIEEMEEFKRLRLYLIPILKCLKKNKKYPSLIMPLNY